MAAKAMEQGEIAKLDYNDLRFAHIKAPAGDPQILTSDPWSFIHRSLSEKLEHSKGENRKNHQRAVYFADIAEDFYRSAERTPLPAQATLYYYYMLNLAKAYLAISGVELEVKPEHHGLSLEQGAEQQIKVYAPMADVVNVFAEFAKALGKPAAGGSLKLVEILEHIPELHALYASLGHANKRKLLPVEIDILVNGARNKLFTEIRYEKKHEAKVDYKKFHKGKRLSYFKEGFPKPGWIVYRSIKQKQFQKNSTNLAYHRILTEYAEFDIVSILTRGGYRYFCDLRPGGLHHLSYALAAMFYVGAAARYRPLEISSTLDGKLRPLLSELVTITPKQYLYQLASLITNKVCLIPFSNI